MLRYGCIPAIDNITCVLINAGLEILACLSYILNAALFAFDHVYDAFGRTVNESMCFVSIGTLGVLEIDAFLDVFTNPAFQFAAFVGTRLDWLGGEFGMN